MTGWGQAVRGAERRTYSPQECRISRRSLSPRPTPVIHNKDEDLEEVDGEEGEAIRLWEHGGIQGGEGPVRGA